MTQSVEVTDTAAQALSVEPSTGGTVTQSQFQQLEINGRNPVYLALLEPGVLGTNIGTFDPDSVSSGAFAINGGRTDAYNVFVDGAVATRTRSSGSMLGAQDINSVQEVQVLTGNYDAEYGRSSAGQIRFVTKSGSRAFHGGVYEALRDAAADANTWSRNSSPLADQHSRPPQQNYNDFGFYIGGPVFVPHKFNSDRSKLFMFVAEERLRRRYQTETTGTVPTAAMQTGDLSGLLSASNPFFGKVRTANDPHHRPAVPRQHHSHQPPERSKGARRPRAYPLLVPGFQQGAANWIQTFGVWSDLNKTTFRTDVYINNKNRLFVRGTRIPWTFSSPLDGTLGLFQEIDARPNRTGVVDLTTTFSPTIVNDLSFSANSDGRGVFYPDPACGAPCNRSTYGISYPYLYPGTKLDPDKLPTVYITGLSTSENGPYPGAWGGFVYDLNDNVTKIWRNHTIKFGDVSQRAGQNDAIQLTTASAPQTDNQNGLFEFLDTGSPNTSGLGIANTLLGNFNYYSGLGPNRIRPGSPIPWTSLHRIPGRPRPSCPFITRVVLAVARLVHNQWHNCAV